MKHKLSSILLVCLITASMQSFGQGYVDFATTKAQGVVWTNAIPGDGQIHVGFLWAALGSVPQVWINGNNTQLVDPYKIFNDPLFRFATNAGALVTTTVNNSGITQGGWNYNSGASFPLQGSNPGSSYTFFAVAWLGDPSPYLAAQNHFLFGFSNPFTYVTAPDSSSAVSTFATSGMSAFGIPTPEPASITIIGTGLAGWLTFGRRFPRM